MNDLVESEQTVDPKAAELLQQYLELAMDEGLHVAAIIDPASFPKAWQKFGVRATGRGGGSLFVGTPHAQDAAVAPFLLPCERTDNSTQQSLADIALKSPAVIWLASALPPDELVPKLTTKLHAELAEGRQPITLRFFDPRVLPELLRVLDSRQLSHLNADVRRWWWLDRRNAVCRHDTATAAQPMTMPMSAPISLTEAQVQLLLEASFVDRVLDVLTRSTPTCLKTFDRAQRQEIAARHVEAAAKWGLTSEFDCASFIAVSLQQGPDFANSPAWAALMDQVKARTLGFSDAIEQWEASDDHLA